MNMFMEHTPDPVVEVRNDAFDADKGYGTFQRILPSRTLYKDDPVYYDPFTGDLIPQNTTEKDVEMPAVGGVLLTNRSRIECGYWG
jgi:hypothetical protein